MGKLPDSATYEQALMGQIVHFSDVLEAAGFPLSGSRTEIQPDGMVVTFWEAADNLVRIEFRKEPPKGFSLSAEPAELWIRFTNPDLGGSTLRQRRVEAI